jgi:CheY-like chemotaxis protein
MNKKTILIIEDNKDMRENTAELLEMAGYSTLTANNGKAGLEVAQKNKPDLILCDIMMPALDGYGVLRALENIPEMIDMPFVFMTAKSEKTDFRKGMDLGADDYLTKPFTGDDLLRIVAARMKKRNNLKEKYENNIHELDGLMHTVNIQQGANILSDHKTIKKIRKKDMLYMEGNKPNFLYCILSGKIKTFKSNERGKEYIIDIHKEGDFLGFNAMMEDGKYMESAMAIENSEVALIAMQDFLHVLDSNSEVALKFAKIISKDFSAMEEKLLKLAYDSARKRVAEAIIFVAQKYREDGKNETSFSLNRENISALSGISPESVSRNLTDFKEEGLIETSNGSIIKVINLKKLEEVKN